MLNDIKKGWNQNQYNYELGYVVKCCIWMCVRGDEFDHFSGWFSCKLFEINTKSLLSNSVLRKCPEVGAVLCYKFTTQVLYPRLETWKKCCIVSSPAALSQAYLGVSLKPTTSHATFRRRRRNFMSQATSPGCRACDRKSGKIGEAPLLWHF